MAKKSTRRGEKVRKASRKKVPPAHIEMNASDERTRHFRLDQLRLDRNNARLGAEAGRLKTQVQILDTIVDMFGIDDVLSSLAVNGYFEAEPMVGVQDAKGGRIRIAEGNRRLAACLILAADDRARNHAKRTGEYQRLQRTYRRPAIEAVPVRILSDSKALLSYLGVRHIAASQPWDSYAKAAWVAKVLDESDLTLENVGQMIGDQHRTVARTLEGYYFVNQLIEAAQFAPGDSLRPGRGSNPDYPFSWVYTALGFGPIRRWLNLADLSREGHDKQPIKGKKKLDEAGELLVFLFGNKSAGRSAAINDSRKIGALARAIAEPESRRHLARGKTVDEVEKFLKPPGDRVSDSLLNAQEALTDALSPLSQGEIGSREADDLLAPSRKVKSQAADVHKRVVAISQSDVDE